ncbi:hypothetical protein LMH73_028060 [Vibrio splendidus]|nr:hypothetical protein [Vibrio splendidus]MCC4882480.1 hypothetical protein [Vibrio splendidus]
MQSTIDKLIQLNKNENRFHKTVFDDCNEITRTIINLSENDFDVATGYLWNNVLIGFSRSRNIYCQLNSDGLKAVKELGLSAFSFDEHKPIKQNNATITFDGDILINGTPSDTDDADSAYIRSVCKSFDVNDDLMKYHSEGYGIMPLKLTRTRILDSLSLLNIDKTIFDSFIYECPFIEGNKHYSALPIMALIKPEHIEQTFKNLNNLLGRTDKQIITEKNYDDPFFQAISMPSSLIQNSEHKALMGQGYTIGTLPSDGMISYEHVLFEYENIFLLVILTIWYNN